MSDLRSIRQSEFQKYFEGWEKQNCIIFNGHCFGQNNINIEEYIHVIAKKNYTNFSIIPRTISINLYFV